jgi:hypothetical protein
VVAFTMLWIESDRSSAYRAMTPWLADLLSSPNAELQSLAFFHEMAARFADHGADGLTTMPSDWLREIGAIGTLDDALEHIAALEAAGVDSVALWPRSDVGIAMSQVDDVVRLAGR